MVQVTIKHDIEDAVRMLNSKVRRQLPFATSKALNETAKLVQSSVQDEFKSRFDRVTPYVVKSVFMKYAKKTNLRADIYIRNNPSAKNPYSLAEIIEQQFRGGTRIRTRLEGALTRAGLISGNEFVAPGAGAKLDRYGNMSRGQIQQLLSQIFASPNPESNRTSSTRSKASVKRAGRIFWSRGDDLPRGAWIVKGGQIRPLLLVVRKPRYKQKIDMNKIALRIVDRHFDRIFKREFAAAVRTAR